MRTHAALCALTIASCSSPGVRAQQPPPAQAQREAGINESTALDAQYRKLDGLLAQLRARNAEPFAIRSENGIDEASYVPIGGIEQWVTVRGQDRRIPVLLFLHGGPGDVTSGTSEARVEP